MSIDYTTGEEPTVDGLSSAANDAVFATKFEPVRRLTLDIGASRVVRQRERLKRDELWLGDAFDPLDPTAPSVPVYVRLGHRGALVAELVCGCVARSLQLPAPEVFVVTVHAGGLPKSRLTSAQGDTLCVGIRDIGGATFTQLLNEDQDAALPLLRSWPELGKVAAFDEWLANLDRNMGNLIYAAQTLHIIDHADAFGGGGRQLFPLSELTHTMFTNHLAGVMDCFESGHRSELLGQVHEWLGHTAANVDIAEVVGLAGTRPWNHPDQDRELIDFLNERLTITHSLLCQRLGHPQLGLTK